MDIKELKSFSLADAVKFHDKLNPKLWFGNRLLPSVKKQLMTIAEDFITFMGISNLDIKDITISGSNAAYSYTPHSDIDLHILVDFSKLPEDEVYKELFGAKKTLYNEKHDITVHKVPVELYVQDTNQEHTSLGEYSLLKDKWIKIPKKRRANFDQIATKAKYEKLGELVELALKSDDLDQVTKVLDIIKRYRRAGLSKAGEFGPENLAFKAVRSQGLIQKLFDKKSKLHSKKISTENMYEQTDKDHLKKLAQAAQAQRGEPEIAMTQAQRALGGGVLTFVIEHVGDIYNRMHNTGYGELDDYNSNEERRYVVLDKIEKTLRTLTRKYGFEREHKENLESNARFFQEHQKLPPEEYMKRVDAALKRYALAHSKLPVYNRPQELARAASIALGEGDYSKAANRLFALRDIAENEKLWHEEINKFSEATTEDWHPNEEPPGPEFRPTMPKGTVRVDVSDVYDWYKLGQHISNMKGLGKHDFGKGPPSTILSFGDEETEHKYIQDLEKTGLATTDIDPPGGKKRQKVDPTYNVSEMSGNLFTDNKPKLIGLSFSELERLSESAGSDYTKFNKTISKNLELPKHKGISSNTLNLYAIYRKQKIYESTDKKLSDTEKKLFRVFNSRVASSIDSAKPGDVVSLLMLTTLLVPNDKTFVNLQGFLSPKQIESITNSNGIDYLHFADGTKFPETDNTDPMYLAQSWAMTKLFDSYDSASKAYLLYVLEGEKLSDEIQFNINVDIKQDITEASGYIPSEKEKNDPRFKTALTKDVRPDAIQKNAKAFGFKVSRSGKPPLLR